ncbi:hypothetical protein QO200_08325 [Flavobacterium sp. Arc3]
MFGTIKRQWGYNHTNLTGLEKVNGEHSLIILVYNIKCSVNILGVADLIAKLKKWNSPCKATACFVCITNYFRLNEIMMRNGNSTKSHTISKRRLCVRTFSQFGFKLNFI